MIFRVLFIFKLNTRTYTYSVFAYRHQSTASLSTPASSQGLQLSAFQFIDRAGQVIDKAVDCMQCECLSGCLSAVITEGLYGLLQCVGKYHRFVTSPTKNLRQMKSSSVVFRENIEECASIFGTFMWGPSNLLWWERKT